MNVRKLFVAASVLLFSFASGAQDRPSASLSAVHSHSDEEGGAFVVREINGAVECAPAVGEEALRINRRPGVPLHVIGKDAAFGKTAQSAGLDIILRGTAQLDANPEAKAAFERAAEIWENKIANPITVFVDVDFGPTRFGTPFEANVIASASSAAFLFGEGGYPELRALIVARADNANETTVYNALPASAMPTEQGPHTRFGGVSMLLRALAVFDPVALPGDAAPSIGFNSAFQYDFDPSDGIAAGRKDFEGVVVHEIGHMLGFVSRVGTDELPTPGQAAPSIFDFYRFRPGITFGTFTTAQRVLGSGGDQLFFANDVPLALSTGRPDGSGGDGQQASHWKDDAQTGTKIGIMDPTLASAERAQLTAADLAAFAIMGWNIVDGPSGCSESEPNETTANADTLGIPGTCGGNVNVSDAFNYQVTNGSLTNKIQDVFVVTLSSTAKIDATLAYTNNTADVDLFLFSSSGATLTLVGSSATLSNPEHVLTNTLPAGTYYVGVSSFIGSSAYTISVTSVGDTPATPTAPSNLTATATSSSVIRLSWADHSNNETEFRIEQKSGSSFVDIGAAVANSTTINITGLPAATSQTFRVRARNAAGNSAYSNEATAITNGVPGVCTPNSTTVCLLGSRFRASISYRNQFSNPPGQTGSFVAARLNPAAINPDTALFGFANPQDVEVVVRVVDARPFAPRFDIYYGGLTDVEYTLTVTDTQTGSTRQYHNPPGTVGGGVDRSSFPAN